MTGLFSGFIGGGFSWLIRLNLGKPVKIIRSGHLYNVILTNHKYIMIFFIVIPTLIGGFGNWLVPLMVAAPDLIFPRVNLLS